MSKKCVHKGCGKLYENDDEECVYHPGPPEFHEGQKGWKCCKTRVLTFDEFLTIPPCTTGKHSTVDDTPAPPAKETSEIPIRNGMAEPAVAPPPSVRPTAAPTTPKAPPAPVESEDDDPSLEIPAGKECRRRGCSAKYTPGADRSKETCVHHPGAPIFHEGSKGYSCCKRRVLEFDQFLKIEGCKTKDRHLFVGSGGKSKRENGAAAAAGEGGEEMLSEVRHDYYQTPTSVIASYYLKKIDPDQSTVEFSDSKTITLDLKTKDHKRFKREVPLFAPIKTESSSFKIMGTKLEFTLAKADGSSWATFGADETPTGEIIQSGKAARMV